MPQLAPLSWLFLCLFLFLVVLGFFGSVWWSKKGSLPLLGGAKGGSSVLVYSSYFWKW